MKRLLILPILFICFNLSFAQNRGEARQKIEAARVAMITNRLQLTPDQAEKFWPIYNEFRQKNQKIKQEYDSTRAGFDPNTASEEEKRGILNMELRLKEERVELERTYSNRILDVISTEQLMELRKAEQDFRRMLLEQLQKRRQQQNRKPNRGGGR